MTRYLYLLLLAFLTGCTSFSQTTQQTTAQLQLPTSPYHSSIDIEGRMSIRYQQNGNDENLQGKFTWSQTPQRTLIALNSPLGQTIAQVEVLPDMAIPTQSGQPKRKAADADTLTEIALGWPLPIAGMRDWLQGVAIDQNGQKIVATAQSESSSTITTQDGWQIRYVSWQSSETAAPTNHPKRIDLTRTTAQVGKVSIRLVIDAWQPQ